jgi:hypothetical protein
MKFGGQKEGPAQRRTSGLLQRGRPFAPGVERDRPFRSIEWANVNGGQLATPLILCNFITDALTFLRKLDAA